MNLIAIVVFMAAATSVAPAPGLTPSPAPASEFGRATRVVPSVELQHGRKKGVLSEKDAVSENDRLKTADTGRARVVLADDSILNVGSNSELTVKAAPSAAGPGTIELAYGKVRAEVAKRAAGGTAFEVRTSTAVCGVLGTTLFVDYEKKDKYSHVINISPLDSGSQVKVRSSNARIKGEVVLNPGQGTLVYKGKAPSQPHTMGEPDRDAARAQTEAEP